MHPLLRNRRRFFLYLVAWLPAAVLLAFFLTSSTGAGWAASLLLAVPVCGMYSFVCLSTWYVCRALPLHAARLGQVVAGQTAAAVICASLYLVTALTIAGAITNLLGGDFYEAAASETETLFALGFLVALLSSAVHYTFLAFESWRDAETRASEARLAARDAEIRALKAQVNPHFLFNSLNSISSLTAFDPSRARQMCVSLGDFYRRTLGAGDKPFISFEEELALFRAYISIEQIRFGPRLRFEEHHSDGCKNFLVPPLLLQPLIENAIRHGIDGLVDGGAISVSTRVEGRALHLEIDNDYDPEAPVRRSSGTGLRNVRNRLAALYGDSAAMEAGERDGRWVVRLSLPPRMEVRT